MNPQADAASLRTSIPTVSTVLENQASALGHDFVAYRNHVYRVVNLCLAIAGGGDQVELEKIAVAAVFHDLGIWTNHTFDYIAPSVKDYDLAILEMEPTRRLLGRIISGVVLIRHFSIEN